jgi:hypothetical protein
METLQYNIEYNQLQEIKKQTNVQSASGKNVDNNPSWQPSIYMFSGKEMLEKYKFNWFWGKYVDDEENGTGYVQYLKNDPVTCESIRSEIVEKLKHPEENIRLLEVKLIVKMRPPQMKLEGVENSIIFDKYSVAYEYRDLKNHIFINDNKTTKSYVSSSEVIKSPGLYSTDEKYSLQEREIIENLLSEDDRGRAELLSDVFNQTDSEFKINQIKAIGFDANYLSYLSIQREDSDLFAFSCAYGPDYANYLVEDKTLLQHLAHSNNSEQIQQCIESSPYLGITVASAVKQSDLLTINHLISHDVNLLKNHYDGYTIMQMAVMQGSDISIETIETLIELDNSCCSILAGSGESTLKLAAGNVNEEIIKLIKKHASIEEEIKQLSSDVDAQLKAEILKNQDIETLIRLFRGENISLEQYLLERVEEEDEEEDIALDELYIDRHFSGALSYERDYLLIEQQDEAVVHLSGNGPNEYFSDLGYE